MISKSLRKLSAVLVGSFLVSALSLDAAQPRGSLRYTVVVDKFENKTGNQRDLGDEWSTLLTSKLHESGRFIVVSQTDMQLSALKEQLRGVSGTTAQGKKTAARGQMTPAQLLVKGVITHFKAGAADQGGGFGIGKVRIAAGRKTTEVRATLQMVDASTGALVAAREFVGVAQQRSFGLQQNDNSGNNVSMGQDDNIPEAFEKALEKAIPWMVEQLPSVQWRGTVVRVDKDTVLINRGSREGVAEGDEFVVGESEVIRDPDTGEVIEEFIRERARIKVVRLNERTSVCTLVSGTIGQVVERMAVKYATEG